MAKREIRESGLTARQEATYDLIVRNSEFGLITYIEEIVYNYPYAKYKDGYILNTNPHTHHPCASVSADIDDINVNLNVSEVILWDDNHGFWVAKSEEEVKAFTKRLYEKQAKKKLWKQGVMRYKAKRNGQTLLQFKDENEQREYWRTFIDDIKEELVDELIKGEE